jgi:hypothetical protein
MKKHCRKRLVDQKTNQGEPQQNVDVVEHTKEKESTLYAFMVKRPIDQLQSPA